MSKIKTESISSLNNLTGNPNMDLGDDGTTAFNGPVVADRVRAGSSNLHYINKTRINGVFIPIPSWATEIEIDFWNFRSSLNATYYNLIRSDLASGVTPAVQRYENTYRQIVDLNSYGLGNPSSGRFGTGTGSTTTFNLLYFFQDFINGNKFSYTGTVKYNKFLFQNETGDTNNIYYVTMNCIYGGYAGTTASGVLYSQGYFYGAGNDPNDVLSQVSFGSNAANNTISGGFNARFREEDPGTLITT